MTEKLLCALLGFALGVCVAQLLNLLHEDKIPCDPKSCPIPLPNQYDELARLKDHLFPSSEVIRVYNPLTKEITIFTDSEQAARFMKNLRENPPSCL